MWDILPSYVQVPNRKLAVTRPNATVDTFMQTPFEGLGTAAAPFPNCDCRPARTSGSSPINSLCQNTNAVDSVCPADNKNPNNPDSICAATAVGFRGELNRACCDNNSTPN